MYLEAKGKRKPIGVLMIEHRLIERALTALEAKVNAGRPDVIAFAELIDFFGTYADATHHGKEEDIMFVEADALAMGDELTRVLAELRDEHVRFRGYRRAMDADNRRLAAGDHAALGELAAKAREFIPLLRQHIVKEDKVFFPGFDLMQKPADRETMMKLFHDFDAERIHETYRLAVEHNE
jgi:hemerythrin-like domain-containing protein